MALTWDTVAQTTALIRRHKCQYCNVVFQCLPCQREMEAAIRQNNKGRYATQDLLYSPEHNPRNAEWKKIFVCPKCAESNNGETAVRTESNNNQS
jgi:transcription elongation factor Elf1